MLFKSTLRKSGVSNIVLILTFALILILIFSAMIYSQSRITTKGLECEEKEGKCVGRNFNRLSFMSKEI